MYDGEYSVSYDYRDYDDEERDDWEPAEVEEFSQCEDKEAFIEHVKKQTQKYGIRKWKSEPKSEPKDFADGLKEYIQSKAGKPISEIYEDDPDEEQSYAELQAETDRRLIEEYNTPEYREKVIQEAVEFYSNIPMYDFGLGKMSNMHAISDFYGLDIMYRIQEEIRESCNLPNDVREVGHISKKLWQELRDIRAGRKSRTESNQKNESARKCSSDPQNNEKKNAQSTKKPKKKRPKSVEVFQRERQKRDDYFLRTERGVVLNRTYREFFGGRTIVYEWLWANLVRKGWIDQKGYPIKKEYYDKGLLAYCSTLAKIADECGLVKNTVIKYLDEFKKAGIIKVDHLVPKGEKRGQSVFILGEWKEVDGEPVERFYRDEIFLSEKPVKN
jgi:predicted transcriptional regulator